MRVTRTNTVHLGVKDGELWIHHTVCSSSGFLSFCAHVLRAWPLMSCEPGDAPKSKHSDNSSLARGSLHCTLTEVKEFKEKHRETTVAQHRFIPTSAYTERNISGSHVLHVERFKMMMAVRQYPADRRNRIVVVDRTGLPRAE